MARFDHAFGQGPEGPSYRPPVPRRRTARERISAWLWYRWGLGHRPVPVYEDPSDS